jgi:hypothetical protein
MTLDWSMNRTTRFHAEMGVHGRNDVPTSAALAAAVAGLVD